MAEVGHDAQRLTDGRAGGGGGDLGGHPVADCLGFEILHPARDFQQHVVLGEFPDDRPAIADHRDQPGVSRQHGSDGRGE